jgi:hypothetical protein
MKDLKLLVKTALTMQIQNLGNVAASQQFTNRQFWVSLANDYKQFVNDSQLS